ncbi:glycoside hydrolase family 2 TIM barrel-domain containing protein [Spirosoma soli]|uniref:Beta-galactosidase n=1 Tax=Spirosoma soli TaxID=1770529 RepID=A0ABW5M4P0_9BACT
MRSCSRFLSLLLLLAHQVVAQKTEIKYLSGTGNDNTINWEFQCTRGRNSGQWTTIPVPSNWEFHGFGNYTYGYEKEDRDEAGLYRHSFTVPASWQNRPVFIVFDGSMTDTEVKINGQLAGPIHQGAFYRFRYNITPLLKVGQPNLLEVKVNKVSANQTVNEAERTADFWVFGGIFRPVFLEAYPAQYLDRIAIDAKADGSVSIDAFPGALKGRSTVIAQVTTLDGKPFGNPFSATVQPGDSVVRLKGQVSQPALWSSEFPNRYRVAVQLKQGATLLHTVTETIGFRTVELRRHDGFYVNGQKIRFKGVNRGAFWPTSGRTTNRKVSIQDANLIKDMNMNAVRSSHYPPDKHFLEVCDSLGLFVIDELTGWQYPPYDTPVGRKLVKELILRDINHPSVVMWANGNEGGFNFDLLPDYPRYDIQKRPVIHPWSLVNGMNTKHYIGYNYGLNTFFNGNEVFFPTEFLHGLYDGGHGAGLDDFWNLMMSNPLSAGGFLWDFCDQAIVRTDKNGELDTKGNSAADGILGPYREKEGSFYTIREVWAPIGFDKQFVSEAFTGQFTIENRYHFTNLNRCRFSWQLKKFSGALGTAPQALAGQATAPSVEPGQKGSLKLALPATWRQYDVLYVSAKDQYGRDICTWSWPITSPDQVTKRVVEKGTGSIAVRDENDQLTMTANEVAVTLDKKTGLLLSAQHRDRTFSLANGPVLLGGEATFASMRHYDTLGTHVVESRYEGKNRFRATWTMHPSGWLELRYQYRPENEQELLGVNFAYPEAQVNGIQLLANGPYRVYKNRLKGGTLDQWQKTYNDAVTGERWEYPEFKGYYSQFYGGTLQTKEGNIRVFTTTDNLFLHLLNPTVPKAAARTQSVATYPASGGISFLHGIPAVGTKTQKKETLGPQSQNNLTFANGGLDTFSGVLYFDFRSQKNQ